MHSSAGQDGDLHRAGARGDLLYQAPEVQRASPGTKIIYSAAG